MKLSEILKGIDVLNKYSDAEVIDVTQDSRLVKEGSLYVCVKGNTFDGHSYGMPKVAYDIGAVCWQVPLEQISQKIHYLLDKRQ